MRSEVREGWNGRDIGQVDWEFGQDLHFLFKIGKTIKLSISTWNKNSSKMLMLEVVELGFLLPFVDIWFELE